MPYVERDADNKIKGVYRQPQPGYAEEFLDETHADVVTYRQPRTDSKQTRRNTLRNRANSTPITVKDLKDIGLL
jgi:hypothetical protein